MNKAKQDKQNKPLKKLTVKDLKNVAGGMMEEPKCTKNDNYSKDYNGEWNSETGKGCGL